MMPRENPVCRFVALDTRIKSGYDDLVYVIAGLDPAIQGRLAKHALR